MEAVKLGWLANQKEVRMEPVSANLFDILDQDATEIREAMEEAKEAALLVPMAMEHVFRTKGQNYISSSQKTEYITSYETIFKASFKSNVGTYLPPHILYHSAFHWITPARVWEVVKKNVETGLIPDAIKLRMFSGAAESALVTTTAAILKEFETEGFMSDLRSSGIVDVDGIFALDGKIPEDLAKYHRNCSAYGLGYLLGNDVVEVERVKEEAKKIAPLLQGFCETVLKKKTLGKQKVLLKYAWVNTVMKKNARKYFQAVSCGVSRSKTAPENSTSSSNPRISCENVGEVFGTKRQRTDRG